MSARIRKTRRYTKVFCCVLRIHPHTRLDSAIMRKCLDPHPVWALPLCKNALKMTVHAVSARFRKTRRYIKVVCCVLMIHPHTRLGLAIMLKCLDPHPVWALQLCMLKFVDPHPVWALQLCKNALKMNCPCCERQIPQDEALYKSRLLRADDPPPPPFEPCNYAKMP